MFESVIFGVMLLAQVYCGPDLCENGALIDSITWVYNHNMWFFTSGGHYWYIKERDFPPQTAGKPLPGGFQKGEAAYYWNSMDACASIQADAKPQTQDIYLTEVVSGQNHLLTFNTKNGEWKNGGKPVIYHTNKALRPANVQWGIPIDGAFIYRDNKLVVIQNITYSVVNIKDLCTDPNKFGVVIDNGKLSTDRFNVDRPIHAMSARNGTTLYLFQNSTFFTLFVREFRESDGYFTTIKNIPMDIVTEFFKFKKSCTPPSSSPSSLLPTGEQTTEQTVTTTQTIETKPPVQEETETPVPEKSEEEEEKGFPWIVVVIVITIIIFIVIVLIACLAMRKSKDKDKEGGPVASANTGSKVVSGVSGGAKGMSKVDSSVDDKSNIKMNSNLGESPSTMSIRSNAGLSKAVAKNKGQNKK